MLTTAAVLAEAGHHVELPMPSFMYGVVALVIFAILGIVAFSYRDVANRHRGKAEAYAKAHADEHGSAGHGGH